mmetsp:Transcript_17556/g.42215  ORF Transcript_17556/g.42215 Transcript_17556/m.42215 type:complete len:114 (+) Transcript_17556:257-598(+)
MDARFEFLRQSPPVVHKMDKNRCSLNFEAFYPYRPCPRLYCCLCLDLRKERIENLENRLEPPVPAITPLMDRHRFPPTIPPVPLALSSLPPLASRPSHTFTNLPSSNTTRTLA